MKGALPLERAGLSMEFLNNRIAAKSQSISFGAGEQTFARHLDRQTFKTNQASQQSKETRSVATAAEKKNPAELVESPDSKKMLTETTPEVAQPEQPPIQQQKQPVENEEVVFSAEELQGLLQMLMWIQQQTVTISENADASTLVMPEIDDEAGEALVRQAQQMGIDLKDLKQMLESVMQGKEPQMAMKALPQEIIMQVDNLLKVIEQMEAKSLRNMAPTDNSANLNSTQITVVNQTAPPSEFGLENQLDQGETKAPIKENSANLKAEQYFAVDTQTATTEIKPPAPLTNPQTAQVDLEVEVADPQRLIEQIVKNMELVQKSGATEMRIQLKPEFLGKMMVTLIIQEGVLTAKFITESHQVKGMLEANMQALKQNLEANGIRVEKTEVGVQVNTGGAFEREFASYQGEAAWAEASERGDGFVRPYWFDVDTPVEEHYALQMEEETDLYPESEMSFAAGRMNLVI